MCDTDDRADVLAAESLPASLEWQGEVLRLEPVDELSVLTVCDNVTDILLPDQEPARRVPLAAMARLAPPLEAPTIIGGAAADVPPAASRSSCPRPAAARWKTPASASSSSGSRRSCTTGRC